MKNILTLVLILFALGAATWYFVWGENFAAVQPYDTLFDLPDALQRTTRIEIVDANGVFIHLEKSKQSDNWFCNNYYLARQDAVQAILEVASQWKMDKPLSQNGIADIKNNLLQNGKQIKYYYDYNHTEAVKHYYIKGGPPTRKGAYMILEGAKDPYVVAVPRIIGSPEIMFHTTLEKWRTHKIFGGTGDQIQQMAVQYPQNPDQSFTILRSPNASQLSLLSLLAPACSKDTIPNQMTLKVLLDQVAKLNIEAFENGYSQRDSILTSPIFCSINIESPIEKLSQQINIYRMPINEKSKLLKMPEGEKQIYDQERFYATINKGKDFVIIQAFAFNNILNKKCSSFY